VHRLLDDELDADGGRQVKDDVVVVDELGDDRLVRHGVDDVVELLLGLEMADVVDRPGGQVVDDRAFGARREPGLRQLGPD
jgi:hypothetical protein